MVIALKGSRRLRAARRAFSAGVRGLTSGPERKRANQLMTGMGVQSGEDGHRPGSGLGWAGDCGGGDWELWDAGQGAAGRAAGEGWSCGLGA